MSQGPKTNKRTPTPLFNTFSKQLLGKLLFLTAVFPELLCYAEGIKHASHKMKTITSKCPKRVLHP